MKKLAFPIPQNEVDAVIGFLESKGFDTNPLPQSTGAIYFETS